MEVLTTNWAGTMDTLVARTTRKALFISPFVSAVALRLFSDLRRRHVACRLITRLHKGDFPPALDVPA